MNHEATSLSLGLGLLAATLTLLTAGSVGVAGFLLGRQAAESSQPRKARKDKELLLESHKQRRLRIASGSASEDVRVSDKKAIVDVRITAIRPLISPAILVEEIPLTNKIAQTVCFNEGLRGGNPVN